MNTPLNSLSFDPCTDKRFYQHLTRAMNETDQNGVLAPSPIVPTNLRALTAPEFQGLAEMPAELEWFANIDNPRTRRAYRTDVADFMRSSVFNARTNPGSLHAPTSSRGGVSWRDAVFLRRLRPALNAMSRHAPDHRYHPPRLLGWRVCLPCCRRTYPHRAYRGTDHVCPPLPPWTKRLTPVKTCSSYRRGSLLKIQHPGAVKRTHPSRCSR